MPKSKKRLLKSVALVKTTQKVKKKQLNEQMQSTMKTSEETKTGRKEKP